MDNLRTGSTPKPRYTQAQKAAAVEYYAANHTPLTQTCRAFGYPTCYVLRQWILEFRLELLKKQSTSCAKDKHLVRYTQAEKQKAVEAMLQKWNLQKNIPPVVYRVGQCLVN